MRIAVLNGVNLNLLGRRDPEQYGTLTYSELETQIYSWAQELGVTVRCRQTNSEGQYVEWCHDALDWADGVIVNPGAWTHYSYAIHDALEPHTAPLVEVHLSNVDEREEWRRFSVLEGLASGAVVDRTFRAGEKFPRVHTEVKNVQYLYDAGDEVVFMDEETYEQFGVPRAEVADVLEFVQPSSSVQMLTVDGRPAGVQMPSSLELAVADTEPGVKGDTVSNVTKPVTLETGAVVQVPLFVNVGDRIKVDPREKRYIQRARGT